MQMKKVMVLSMLAATLGATAVSPVMAQSVAQTKQAVQIGQSTYNINGNSIVLRTVVDSGSKLVSLRDLTLAIGASLQVSKELITVQLNHNVVKLKSNAVKSVNGSTFVDPSTFIKALGGTYVGNTATPSITTASLLSDVDHAVWVNDSKLIVSRTTDDGRQDYLVDAATGSYVLLLTSSDTSDLVVSPNGKKAAYSNADGSVNVIDLSTKQVTEVSKDSSIKNELQWSTDASSLFFLQGDKSSVIAKLNLTDGSVSKVLEDKVDYKANLSSSSDGKKFAFNVLKQPKVTADGSIAVELDDVSIDATGTDPQVFFYNSEVADNKPVQLTTEATDKVFLQLSADGAEAYYVNLTNDEASVGSLVAVNSENQTSDVVFAEKDVYEVTLSGGKLYLLTAGGATSNQIYEVNPATGVSQIISNVSDGVSEIFVSPNGKIAALSNGLLAVSIDGKFTTITR